MAALTTTYLAADAEAELAALRQQLAEARTEADNHQQELNRILLEQAHTYGVEIPALRQLLAHYDAWLSQGVYFTNEEFQAHIAKQKKHLATARQAVWEEAAKEWDKRTENCSVALSGRLAERNIWFWEEREKEIWEANRTMLKHLADWCREQARKEQP